MCIKMSDVRLSNASPTVERVDARQPDAVRPSVRRNLFGTPDQEEVRRYLTASLREDVQAFTERYNYDPVSDAPLSPGNYEWQEDPDAPEFYRRPPHGSERQGPEERKRRPGASGTCSSESPSKRLHTDEEDDEDPSDGAGSQAVGALKESPTRPENIAEVQ